MKANEIESKITSAKNRIEKTEKALITAKAAIEKMEAKLETGDESRDWEYELREKRKAIKKNETQLETSKETLRKLEEKLTAVSEEDEIINKEMPAVFKKLVDELTGNWDKFDIAERDVFRKDEQEMTRFELRNKYGYSHNFYISDKEIHERNAKAAEKSVLNMFHKVRTITGPVKEFKGIYVRDGELNGVVEGENGSASVQTVVAGGHSVQRLHIRVLVHKLK